MILTVDIETVPQARYVDPATYLTPVDGGHRHALVAAECTLIADDWTVDYGRYASLDEALMAGEVPLAATGCTPSLHATTCHIVQVSFGWRSANVGASVGVGGAVETRIVQTDDYAGTPEEAEARLLCDALRLIGSAVAKGTRLVSFNGKGFDLPVLRARCAILRLAPPKLPWRRLLYPFADDQHADLRLVLSGDKRFAHGSLQTWADSFGIHAEEHGVDVWPWARAGEWAKLRAYGECEARTLVELFDAVEAYL